MQRHVPLLDSDRAQRSQRRHVLREADRRHDAGQLLRPRVSHHPEQDGDERVRFHCPADRADLDRHFDAPMQGAVLHPPSGQRLVAAVAGAIRVSAGLDGPPIVAGRQCYGVHAVHHALVVRACPVWIGVGEPRRFGDPVRHFRAGESEVGQRLERDAARRAGQTQIGEVGQDPQPDPPARDALDQRRHAFAHGVDQVRAHRVLRVHDQVHDGVRLGPHRDQAHYQVLGAAAARLHGGVERVRRGEDCVLFAQDGRLGHVRVRELGDLHLADHARLVGVGGETSAFPRDLRRQRHRRDHRRLLHGHRDQHVLTVDEEVEPDAHGQTKDPDRVLDHRVRVRQRQGCALAQAFQLVARQLQLLGQSPQPLRHLHLVEARQPARTHPVSSPGDWSVARKQTGRTPRTLKTTSHYVPEGCGAYMKVAPKNDEDFGKSRRPVT